MSFLFHRLFTWHSCHRGCRAAKRWENIEGLYGKEKFWWGKQGCVVIRARVPCLLMETTYVCMQWAVVLNIEAPSNSISLAFWPLSIGCLLEKHSCTKGISSRSLIHCDEWILLVFERNYLLQPQWVHAQLQHFRMFRPISMKTEFLWSFTWHF